MSVDTAYRLARYFQTSPEFWLNLQTKYDLEIYKNQNLLEVEKEVGIFNLNLTTAKVSYNVWHSKFLLDVSLFLWVLN